jgi:hypothetical protein
VGAGSVAVGTRSAAVSGVQTGSGVGSVSADFTTTALGTTAVAAVNAVTPTYAVQLSGVSAQVRFGFMQQVGGTLVVPSPLENLYAQTKRLEFYTRSQPEIIFALTIDPTVFATTDPSETTGMTAS